MKSQLFIFHRENNRILVDASIVERTDCWKSAVLLGLHDPTTPHTMIKHDSFHCYDKTRQFSSSNDFAHTLTYVKLALHAMTW